MSIIFHARQLRDENRYDYEHTQAVRPGPHAVANAAQAAMLLEQDRRNTRDDSLRSDLLRQRARLLAELSRVDAALEALGHV